MRLHGRRCAAPSPHHLYRFMKFEDDSQNLRVRLRVIQTLVILMIAALGVRRISVGGALALAAWTGFMRAAQALKSDGSFAGLAELASYSDINDFLAADLRTRQMRGTMRTAEAHK